MPASRNAAATTLAPRSCPSSPGFPTSTRILRCMPIPQGPSPRRDSALVVLVRLHRQRLLGLVVRAARHHEVLGAHGDRAPLLVALPAHDPLLEQRQRHARRLLCLEGVRPVVVVAPQRLEPP